MMSWSCPFHAVQPPLHVPDIFSVCPLLFPCMSRSFAASQCRLVSLCFVSLSFPCTPLVFMSLSPLFPFRAPMLSCHVDFLFPPLISLHFLAFPLCSPQKHGFSSAFATRTRISSRQSLGPLFCDTGFPKTTSSGTSSNCRAVLGVCVCCFLLHIDLFTHSAYMMAQGPSSSIVQSLDAWYIDKRLARFTGITISTSHQPSSNPPYLPLGLSPQ